MLIQYLTIKGHVLPGSTSRLAGAIKFLSLSVLFAREMMMKCVCLGPYMVHS